jgi:hypothetical protein
LSFVAGFGVSGSALNGSGTAKNGANVASTQKDPLLTYMYLRLMRTRDCKTTALHLLNYARSMQRTIVLDLQGLLEGFQLLYSFHKKKFACR